MLLYQKIQIQIGFWYIIFNFFNFLKDFKDCFNKHAYSFDDVIKKATLGLLKIKVFWNKDHDVIRLVTLAFLWKKLSVIVL